jgi:AraC-like DNA-binding protein
MLKNWRKEPVFPPYYFCRMFQCGVGSSIMEYVRSRRLAYAASELNSGRKLLNIAVDYGFETHSGFSKAFRRYFGCLPEIYRAYATFDVPKIPDLSKANQFVSEFVIEPKIIAKKTSFKIAGFAIKIKLPVNISSPVPHYLDPQSPVTDIDDNSIAFELYDERSMPDTGKICSIYIPIINRQL